MIALALVAPRAWPWLEFASARPRFAFDGCDGTRWLIGSGGAVRFDEPLSPRLVRWSLPPLAAIRAALCQPEPYLIALDERGEGWLLAPTKGSAEALGTGRLEPVNDGAREGLLAWKSSGGGANDRVARAVGNGWIGVLPDGCR